MKIYLDNNLGVANVEQEELTQDTIGYNILKVYIPNAVLTPYDTFTCYYGALLQNGRKVGWFAMEARTSSDADYEANYTLYKATLEQCVVSVEGKVYIGCQVLLGNSGNATLIKKNTAVVQFNVRKSVAINNDILVLDTDQTTTDVLESYKNLLENALLTYATKAEVYTKTQIDALLLQKADKSDTYTKQESDNIFAPKSTAITHTGNQLQDYSGNNIYPILDAKTQAKIDNAYGPAYVGKDTSTNILAFTTNKGIYIGSDTGHWYYWDGSHYVDGGVFQAIELNDESVTMDKLDPKIQATLEDVEKILYTSVTLNCYAEDPSSFSSSIGPNQYWAYSLYIPAGCYLETINFYLSTYSILTFYLCELGDNNTLDVIETISSTRYEEGNNTINHFYECVNDTYIVVGTSNRSGLQYKSGSDGIGRLNNYTLSGTTFTQTQSLNKWQLGLSFTYIKQKEESYTLKVAKDGSGDFTTINEALSYAYTIESKQNPVTILIYSGVYKEVCNIKGTHNISLVGINRNTCIIRDDSGIYNNAPLRIEGNCYIANLTLIATHNDKNDYVVNGVLNYNPSYALHIDDRHPDDDDDYLVTIFNCVCYSEQNSALGVGMDKKTTIQLIQCEFITNYTDDMFTITDSTGQWAYKSQNGAIFYHALYDGHYTDSTGYQRLMIKDCIMKSNIQYAIFGESGGLMQYVETTFINNVGYSANGFTAHRLSGETLQPLSYGNNITDLNYQP